MCPPQGSAFPSCDPLANSLSFSLFSLPKLNVCVTSSWKCSLCSILFSPAQTDLITSTLLSRALFLLSPWCSTELTSHDCVGWSPSQNGTVTSPRAGGRAWRLCGGGSTASGSVPGVAKASWQREWRSADIPYAPLHPTESFVIGLGSRDQLWPIGCDHKCVPSGPMLIKSRSSAFSSPASEDFCKDGGSLRWANPGSLNHWLEENLHQQMVLCKNEKWP